MLLLRRWLWRMMLLNNIYIIMRRFLSNTMKGGGRVGRKRLRCSSSRRLSSLSSVVIDEEPPIKHNYKITSTLIPPVFSLSASLSSFIGSEKYDYHNYHRFVLKVALPLHNGQRRNFTTSPSSQHNGNVNEDNNKEQPNSNNSLNNIWNQLRSPPNIITITRIACTPILVYWIVTDQNQLAIAGVIIASISDGLDGYLAKNYNMATVVGSYLDPIADKIMVNSLGLSLWYSGILPTPLILLWATKDVLLLSGTAYNVYQRHSSLNFIKTPTSGQNTIKVTPTFLGKASTAFQFVTICVGVSMPVFTTVLTPGILENLCWLSGGFTIASTLSYVGKNTGLVLMQQKQLEDNDDTKKR